MALYAIGDLHLSLGGSKSMDVFGGRWENYVDKIAEGFSELSPDDVTVLCGDLSWGMSLEEAKEDFKFIDQLPGRKIVLKGNHDYWWSTAAAAYRFFEENGITTVDVLNNNFYQYGEKAAICGTRGWFYEEETGSEHDRKIMLREIGRLETSLKAAENLDKYVFLHYPPKYYNYECREILDLLLKYDVKVCAAGHIHSKGCKFAFEGMFRGTEHMLISADHIFFKPKKILNF